MRQFFSNLLRATSVLLCLVSPAIAETRTPTQDARIRAYERIIEARREGLSIVHTATEIIVERDKLCIADFTLVSKKTLRESNRVCFTVKGAYDKRMAGLERSRIASVRQYVLSYSTCGEWEDLVTDVISREDIFPELQHLVVHDALVRGYVLRTIVGHQALFYNPATKGLGHC